MTYIVALAAAVVLLTALIAYVAERDLRRRQERFRESMEWLKRQVQGR